MNIHEYQAKELMSSFGISVLPGHLAKTPEEAKAAAQKLGTSVCVVKAQVHAGGRGKGGGIQLCKSADEAFAAAKKLLGTRLVTPQTGPEGKPVHCVFVEAGCDIDKEFYVAFLLNRKTGLTRLIVSSEGGMDIEEVAKTHPEKIYAFDIEEVVGLASHQLRSLFFRLEIPKPLQKAFSSVLKQLYQVYRKTDASLIEVNPLISTPQGDVIPLDGKFNFDPNALYRQRFLEKYYDPFQEVEAEVEAAKHDLSFIKLEGNVGCLVNGAGLAMATMDMIQLHGGRPANFLDVGGSATTEKVTAAFKLILKDPEVKGILVNIFGGIMRCDTISTGIVNACKEAQLSVPLVVRLEGTQVDEGRAILDESGLNLLTAKSLSEGAALILRMIQNPKDQEESQNVHLR